jgi:hypothetical protein
MDEEERVHISNSGYNIHILRTYSLIINVHLLQTKYKSGLHNGRVLLIIMSNQYEGSISSSEITYKMFCHHKTAETANSHTPNHIRYY